METLYITHPACHLHEMGVWHPESPNRLDAVSKQLLASDLASHLHSHQARAASREDILRVHTSQHLEYLHEKAPTQGYFSIDADTIMNAHTLEAAYHAAGAGLDAVDALMAGQMRQAFCSVRPPGHHASSDRAMGFCFFNNVAIAVAYALEKYPLQRVLIVDFDVHHGNGTEDIFAHDERVLMCGFFQHPYFPGSFHQPQAKNMLNIPMEAHTQADRILERFEKLCLPRIVAFEPELVFFSAGFDAHSDDEMGQLGLVEADFSALTRMVMQATAKSAQGRVISLLEGGYELLSLGRSVEAHIRAMSA